MKFQSAVSRRPATRAGSASAASKRKFRVIIADESTLSRMGLRALLEHDDRFEIVAEADQGEQALKSILTHKPDVAVLDSDLPGIKGLDVVGLLNAKKAGVNLVILAAQKDESLFNQAINLGARGYLLEQSSAVEILNCIVAVASGESYVSPVLSDFLLRRRSRVNGLSRRQAGLSDLTAAERRILKCIALGRTSREIASECGISPRTVDSHRAHISEKLNLSGSNRLLQFALENRDALSQLD